MALIPEFYLNSVVSIGVMDVKEQQLHWIGTGFFIYRKLADKDKQSNGDAIPFLVTNKHVISNKNLIYIRLKSKNSNKLHTVPVDLIVNGEKIYREHSNPQIDIAIIQISGDFLKQNNILFCGFDIDENAMTSSVLRKNGIDEGTLIYMLGFPMGLVNENSLFPVCRLGCIARMNEAQINDTKNFLADIQNFPGNSGSPIINKIEINTLEGTKNLNKTVLIGIVHSYIPYQETLLNTQTNQIVEIRSENSGIANVHPVEFIREIVDLIYKNN